MKLILIRHAKSSWESPVPDCQRSLSRRGISDAHLVSEKLKTILPNKFVIWTSTAKRAIETSLIFALNCSIPLEFIVKKEELYTFELSELEKVIKKCKKKHKNLIIFGHNDAITKFVNKFGDLDIENVPTSGVVDIEFEQTDWSKIKKGVIIKTIFPKDFRNEYKITY